MKTKRSLKMNDMESRILERKEQMMVKGGWEVSLLLFASVL